MDDVKAIPIHAFERWVIFDTDRYDTDPKYYNRLCSTIYDLSHGGIKVDLSALSYGIIVILWNDIKLQHSAISIEGTVEKAVACVRATGCKG